MSLDTEAPTAGLGQGESRALDSLPAGKHPRDHGEELKGLPLSADESDRSPAISKKQKTAHAETGSGDGAGLDEGEMSESVPSLDPPSATRNPSSSRAMEEVGKDSVSDATTREPPADGVANADEAASGPQPPSNPDGPSFADKPGSRPGQRPGWNRGVALGARTSFKKGATQLFATNTPIQIVSEEPSSPASPGREREPDAGSKAADYDEAATSPESSTQAPADVSKPLDGQAYQTTFNSGKHTWHLPPTAGFEVSVENDALTSVFWVQRLEPWTMGLCQANPDQADRLTGRVVRKAFDLQIRRKMGYLQGTRKRVQAARDIARDVIACFKDDQLDTMVSKVRDQFRARENGSTEVLEAAGASVAPTRGSGDEGDIEENVLTAILAKSKRNEMTPEEELRQLRMYFPGVEDPSRHCLFCSGVGHGARECPQLQCKFCGSLDHSSFGCPTKERCTKCRQIGHGNVTCQEKLSLAWGEDGPCPICGAEHTEKQCTEIWRSFAPAATHRKVKDIPAFCYTCGAEGHYGPECGLPDKGGKVTGTTTWSQANRLMYVDPDSPDTAIAWIGVDLSQPQSQDFHVPGRARRPIHTYFTSSDTSSDDESDEDLIHAPVNRQPPPNPIRIASNIGSTTQGANGGGARGQPRRNHDQGRGRKTERRPGSPSAPSSIQNSWGLPRQAPTAPSGPPPSRGRNGARGSLATAPPGALPPRPQAPRQGPGRVPQPDRGAQNSRGNQGGRGGRGGGRGRGRGRGQ
ncbi:hypothetical protein GGS23DRAFT_588164 [Durotheca rogersii]|uniref:uncharacterized protein n=1 Tax=Durotheca rogersii TaxID=419775 RepID=UPI00221F5049|nr:uncharacterized protein GGS23DRAFT_588164 [Durotheca rogersii]KAI5857324.1 hypothetical protein GGS23DRAFT_588164 [Durotheca rogersii]